jgi:predicted ribosome-associated RNA-binding protein Tma20
MTKQTKQNLSNQETEELINKLKRRFQENMNHHKNIKWAEVENKLLLNKDKL